jgi:hypothetical protein
MERFFPGRLKLSSLRQYNHWPGKLRPGARAQFEARQKKAL